MPSDALARDPGPAGPDAAKIAAIAAAAIGAAFSVAALVLFSGRTAFSVAAGTVIAVANLVMLSAIIRAMMRPAQEEADAEAAAQAAAATRAANGPTADAEAEAEPPPPEPDHTAAGRRGGVAWGGFAVLKMVFLFGGVWILLTKDLVDPIPLVVGYGTLPLGITVSGLFSALFPGRK